MGFISFYAIQYLPNFLYSAYATFRIIKELK